MPLYFDWSIKSLKSSVFQKLCFSEESGWEYCFLIMDNLSKGQYMLWATIHISQYMFFIFWTILSVYLLIFLISAVITNGMFTNRIGIWMHIIAQINTIDFDLFNSFLFLSFIKYLYFLVLHCLNFLDLEPEFFHF